VPFQLQATMWQLDRIVAQQFLRRRLAAILGPTRIKRLLHLLITPTTSIGTLFTLPRILQATVTLPISRSSPDRTPTHSCSKGVNSMTFFLLENYFEFGITSGIKELIPLILVRMLSNNLLAYFSISRYCYYHLHSVFDHIPYHSY